VLFGLGRVKLGTHVDTNHRVAIKILPKSMLQKKDKKGDPDSLMKKLEREIAIMKLIQHPSIMALYDVYESSDELSVDEVNGGM
jgi:serine/threonine-protein kinase HSL1 (negative regulator of Swe1 kinase)